MTFNLHVQQYLLNLQEKNRETIETLSYKDFKFLLVLSVLALSIIGVLAVGSAEPSSQMKQIIGIIMGIIVMVIISMIDYEWLLNLYWLIYGFNLLLLLYVHFLGMELNGAK